MSRVCCALSISSKVGSGNALSPNKLEVGNWIFCALTLSRSSVARFAQPELVRERQLSAASLSDEVQSNSVKVRLFGGTITFVGNLSPDLGRVGVPVFSQHNRKRVNQAVNFRFHLIFQAIEPLTAQSLKSLLQEIEPITKCLIARQSGKPVFPIVLGELVNRFFLKQPVVVTEEENSNQFLIGKNRCGIIAQALKTSRGTSIVSLTDTQI